MLDPSTPSKSGGGVGALKQKLETIRARQPAIEPSMVSDVVRAVLTTIGQDLTAKESTLLREVEELGQTIAAAKSDIAALRVDDITDQHIPFATDELDAIVDHTAQATNAILESCETMEEVANGLSGEAAAKLQAAITSIYEACGFQDITGQRITKIVSTLKVIETKVAHIMATFGRPQGGATPATPHVPSDADLLNGPQLPTQAMDQSSIDALLASFE